MLRFTGVPFVKMHGLGNDFVVLDARSRAFSLDADRIRAIADRHTGVGCDQLVVMGPARAGEADVFMSIYNADGDEVSACGNATRCVGALVMNEGGGDRVVVETRAGLLDARRAEGGGVEVDMGPARLEWDEIPLSRRVDTLHLPLIRGPLADPVGVSMGNPHAVFFVPDVHAVDLTSHGPVLEHDPLFPERANIEAVQVLDRARLRMRVWERGTGITRACGTGACAALVAAARRGLADRRAEVILDGGSLEIEWRGDGRVMMTGPVAASFSGVLHGSLSP
ncbi:MAG: diaminopimelate epimerase [Alphaproteobacteria bacterium]|nr:diaminopimelate epimerase [Alphaproteobacteria bacterium]